MADAKITALAELTAPDPDADWVEVIDASDTSMAADGTNKKMRLRRAGAVIAVKSATKTDTQSTTSSNGTWVDVTGLSITHTPVDAGNRVLLRCSVCCTGYPGAGGVAFRLVRDGSGIGVGDAASTRLRAAVAFYTPDNTWPGAAAFEFADTPGDTSSHTWGVQFCALSGGGTTAYINRSYSDSDAAYTVRGVSTLNLAELA